MDDDWVTDEDLEDDRPGDVDPDAPAATTDPAKPASATRRRTVGGAMLAAAMFGLQEALEGPRPEPAITEVGNSDPNDDDVLAVDLDPYDPSASIAVVRPWLHDQP